MHDRCSNWTCLTRSLTNDLNVNEYAGKVENNFSMWHDSIIGLLIDPQLSYMSILMCYLPNYLSSLNDCPGTILCVISSPVFVSDL